MKLYKDIHIEKHLIKGKERFGVFGFSIGTIGGYSFKLQLSPFLPTIEQAEAIKVEVEEENK